jgi:hypothetical protein
VESNSAYLVPVWAKDLRRDLILPEDEIKTVWTALNKEVRKADGSDRKRQAFTAARNNAGAEQEEGGELGRFDPAQSSESLIGHIH